MDPLAVVAVEFGTVPDWLAAAGTSFATIVAAVAVNREVQRRRAEQVAEFSRQARRVLCWLDIAEVDDQHLPPYVRAVPRLAVIIHNGSGEPVFDCRAHVEVDPDVLAEMKDVGRRRLAFGESIIPPGDMKHILALPPGVRSSSRVLMVFTDANGTRWQRGSDGRLRQLVDPLGQASVAPRVGCGALWHGPRR